MPIQADWCKIILEAAYRTGSKGFCEQQGILALTLDDLPNLNMVVAERFYNCYLPKPLLVGTILTIMEMR